MLYPFLFALKRSDENWQQNFVEIFLCSPGALNVENEARYAEEKRFRSFWNRVNKEQTCCAKFLVVDKMVVIGNVRGTL